MPIYALARDNSRNASSAAASSPVKKSKDVYSTGIVYGRLSYVHPEFISIVVEPLENNGPRKIVYLDRQTIHRDAGKRRPLHDLHPSGKVAVRYIANNRFHLAEAIFVVHGEFNPPDYAKRKPRARVSKPSKPAKKKH